jgi:hypothetical protein
LGSRDSVAYIYLLYVIYILQNSAGGGGGGLYRLQPPRDGGGAADARVEGRRSTTGRQRWRRCGGAGEGCKRDCELRNACTVFVQVGKNSVCAVEMVGRPM